MQLLLYYLIFMMPGKSFFFLERSAPKYSDLSTDLCSVFSRNRERDLNAQLASPFAKYSRNGANRAVSFAFLEKKRKEKTNVKRRKKNQLTRAGFLRFVVEA